MLNTTVQKKALIDCFVLIFAQSISSDKPFSKVMPILQQFFPVCLMLDRLATPPN